MHTIIQVQILDETICTSYSTNTTEKGMNLNILPPVMGKEDGQTKFFIHSIATSQKEKLWIQTC